MELIKLFIRHKLTQSSKPQWLYSKSTDEKLEKAKNMKKVIQTYRLDNQPLLGKGRETGLGRAAKIGPTKRGLENYNCKLKWKTSYENWVEKSSVIVDKTKLTNKSKGNYFWIQLSVGSTNRDSTGQGGLVRVLLFSKSHCTTYVLAQCVTLYDVIA